MGCKKLFVFISEAGSVGVTLQANRREVDQARSGIREIHLVLFDPVNKRNTMTCINDHETGIEQEKALLYRWIQAQIPKVVLDVVKGLKDEVGDSDKLDNEAVVKA
ncbi:hypothetical protein Tco_1159807, partial [Tanacetum coccineum]